MFVVKKAFRDSKGVRSVGSIVEPTDVNRFKYRFGGNYIVEVNEHNFNRYAEYFKVRCGVDLAPLPSIKLEAPIVEEPAKEEIKATTDNKVVVVARSKAL